MKFISDSYMKGRPLTSAETAQLQAQGCAAEDWTKISVATDFNPQYVHDVSFSGTIYLGKFDKTITLQGGIVRHSGITHAILHNTNIGDNCLVSGIAGGIANYHIENDCVIINSDTIVVDKETCFGQGTEITVLSETGGREIIIHDMLSSHEAYMQAMYRHDKKLNEKLRSLAYARAESFRSKTGFIGEGTVINRCGYIANTYIAPYSTLEGVTRLENGTICSEKESPTFIGDNVIAHDFIIQSGCKITEAAMLSRCYVGQSTVIGHGYSATESFFGCNCQAENGEACAIFAGPYTVTHHKSTLLIGGMFSFMNAGSGTNQSNHMYKLGPSHHGILERGCKTASGSHILWPAKVGAFTMIMGHYQEHADTDIFPFSYLIEQKGMSYLIPGIALRNIGTLRDIQKWPKRDGRAPLSSHQDHIIFDAYSPFTIYKMQQGLSHLREMELLMNEDQQENTWKGLKIKRKHITSGQSLYRMAINRYIGEQLMDRLKDLKHLPKEELYTALQPHEDACDEWCDISGLQAPKSEILRLKKDLKKDVITSVEELNERYAELYLKYKEYAWAWAWKLIQTMYPHVTKDNFINMACFPIICQWESATYNLNDLLIKDAKKEFSSASCVGFGIDGDEETAQKDFLAVRGSFEKNSLIQDIEKQKEGTKKTAEMWLKKLTSSPYKN